MTAGPRTQSCPGSPSGTMSPASSTSFQSNVGMIGPQDAGFEVKNAALLAVTMPCVSVRP